MASSYFIYPYNGEDIHVLRNSTATSKISFDASAFFDIPDGFSSQDVKYLLPGGVPLTPGGFDGIIPEAAGIGLNLFAHAPATGTIQISTIYAKITYTPSNPADNEEILIVRVNIHDAVDEVWMDPVPVILTPLFSLRKPFVHVRFSDGIVADVTGHYGLVWTITADDYVEYTADGNGQVKIKATPSSFPYTATDVIKVTLPPYLKNGSGTAVDAKGTVTIKNDIASRELSLLSTALLDPAMHMNVLLIPDGMTDTTTNRDAFLTCAKSLIEYFNSNDLSNPYNLLGGSINYWSYFLPTENDNGGGIQVEDCLMLSDPGAAEASFMIYNDYIYLCDLIIKELNGENGIKGKIRQLFEVLAPPLMDLLTGSASDQSLIEDSYSSSGPSSFYTLTELIDAHYVGFPSKEDFERTGTGGDAYAKMQNRLNTQKTLWSTVHNPLFDYSKINPFIYNMWLRIYKRINLQKVQTAVGMANGSISKLNWLNKNNIGIFIRSLGMEMHPFQMIDKANTLNKFIASLTYKGQNIGQHFFNAADGKKAKDGNFLCIINNTVSVSVGGMMIREGGFDGTVGWYLTVPIRYGGEYVQIQGTTVFKPYMQIQGVKIDTGKYKQKVPDPHAFNEKTFQTCLHEFSHNFVEDEYAIQNSILPASDTDPLYISRNRANLQFLNPDLQTSGQLDATKTRWLWPRIAKVGIMQAALSGTHPNYTVTINRSFPDIALSDTIPDYTPLAEGNEVWLRHPDLYHHHDYPVFKINTIDADKITYHISYVSGTFDSAHASDNFPANSLLIYPRRDTDGNVMKLIHSQVVANMNSAVPPAPLVTTDDKLRQIQTPNKKLLRGLSKPRDTYKIVGLYAGGGAFYSTGIYHPAGRCIMRSYTNMDQNDNVFCPVCKYIIVDHIDPLKHPKIDLDYNADYPSK